jgi:transposase
MICVPNAIYVASVPVNLRLSFDRLAGIVREVLGGDPRGEAMFVFHNRARTHLKVLFHDGRGYCLLYKRLDRGRYRMPLVVPPGAVQVVIGRRDLERLLEGVDATALRRARKIARELGSARRSDVVTMRDPT